MITVLVSLIYKINRLFTRTFGKKINVLILIAGSNQLLQAEKLEVVSKIFEEVTDTRVITVTQDRLTTEMPAVMTQLIIYIFKLSIKLIFLGFLSLIEILISHPLLKSDLDDGYLSYFQ